MLFKVTHLNMEWDFLFDNTPFPQFEENMHAHNLCSPSFLGPEVNKAVFAYVCLEKGGYLDFSQLLSYRKFFKLKYVLTIQDTILPSKFLFNKAGHQKI